LFGRSINLIVTSELTSPPSDH